MNLIELALDGGMAVQLLLVPAIVGTAVVGSIRLLARRPRGGVFEGSLSIVLGAAGVSVAIQLMIALDMLAQQGQSPAVAVAFFRFAGGTFFLALIGVAVLGTLELASTLRHRTLPAPARWLRPTVVTGWVAATVAVAAELACLLRIAASLDALPVEPSRS